MRGHIRQSFHGIGFTKPRNIVEAFIGTSGGYIGMVKVSSP